MFFACGIWCVADVSSVSPSSDRLAVCSDEGLTLETSATHHIPQIKYIYKLVTVIRCHTAKEKGHLLCFQCDPFDVSFMIKLNISVI